MSLRVHRQGPVAFTIVELMIVVSVISMLVSVLMPVVGRARSIARSVKCMGNLRQLAQAWQMYAEDYGGYCMPQVWFAARPFLYWWGVYSSPPDHTQGLLYPYLVGDAATGVTAPEMLDTVFDCPEQPWGSYVPQGAGRHPTTTYGYNGLYFCPPHSGWDWSVRDANAQWRALDQIQSASQVFVFADTLLDWGAYQKNCCLLDGPQMPAGAGRWMANNYPTLCFRHRGRACVSHADGHAGRFAEGQATLTSPTVHIGHVGKHNAPHYVPDWRRW